MLCLALFVIISLKIEYGVIPRKWDGNAQDNG